ncbi:MAG TPA: hypothetical protein H9770_09365 [Candidatus Fournierella excrementigallinarum]|nr:hypothetical protein [Candidatus Fournierella excrementigallinarum]
MIYLIIGVLLSSLVTILFKVADRLRLNSDNLILVNYSLAAVVSGVLCGQAGLYAGLPARLMSADIPTLLTAKTPGNTCFLLMIVGFFSGVYYIVDLFNTKSSVIYNGATLTALFGKFGFLISTFTAAIVWKEIPTGLQFIGILLAITGILLASGGLKNAGGAKKPLLLAALVLTGGLMEINGKCAVYYTIEGFDSLYVNVIFTTAFLLCVANTARTCIRTGTRFTISWRDIAGGVILGLPNVAGSYLALMAMQTVPANIYFPTNAVGNLVVVSLAGMLLFREKTNAMQKLAIVVTVVSLTLLNL